jgi:hypothetical protein
LSIGRIYTIVIYGSRNIDERFKKIKRIEIEIEILGIKLEFKEILPNDINNTEKRIIVIGFRIY